MKWSDDYFVVICGNSCWIVEWDWALVISLLCANTLS